MKISGVRVETFEAGMGSIPIGDGGRGGIVKMETLAMLKNQRISGENLGFWASETYLRLFQSWTFSNERLETQPFIPTNTRHGRTISHFGWSIRFDGISESVFTSTKLTTNTCSLAGTVNIVVNTSFT